MSVHPSEVGTAPHLAVLTNTLRTQAAPMPQRTAPGALHPRQLSSEWRDPVRLNWAATPAVPVPTLN